MVFVGDKSQGIREVRFYLAKVVPDLERNEPLNCGLIIRRAESKELTYRFLDIPPVEVDGYTETIGNWKAAIASHGSQSLHFMGKRHGNKYANPALYLELAFTRMVSGRIDFDAAFERLVTRR